MRNSFLIAFLIGFSFLGFGQRNVRDSAIATPWIAIHYGLNAPGGDLKERFGVINHVGAMAGYKTSRNWVYGLDGNFMFGNKVKTPDMFAAITNSYGYIHDANGDVAIVVVNMRGFNVNAMVGKVFPVLSPNKNSGLYVHAGLGYVQHKIRVETQDQVVPTLELKYRKGYDRYTTGLNFHQFAGYAFMANQGFVNFYAGFYIQEGLTYNRRDIFFDQPDVPVSKAQRLDLQYGFKVGWFVPVYKRKPKDYYFE
ncbi:hypothetical protein [uncultured Fluviicola sp.]|uniref:hypothetical protein n=1 Tax=uncultured Fluviicola sp. TaxID=463303 RepID=UPI0025DDABF9|nr:hypothetical protein [uncultured Fluviicola sp.]